MKITSILISLILIESSFAQGMAPRDWGLIVVDFNGDGIVDSADEGSQRCGMLKEPVDTGHPNFVQPSSA